MVSAGQYFLSAVLLAGLILSLAFSAVCLRRQLMPAWDGPPARLVEAVTGIALLIWLAELLGLVGLLYAGTLVAASLALAGIVALASGWRGGQGWSPPVRRPLFRTDHSARDAASEAKNPAREGTTPGLPTLPCLIALGVVAVVFAHWGLTTKDALDRGIFNFDSLWYHLPFAVEMAHSHSVTGFHHSETVFVNWFYPQNSELLHAVGILLTGRDTLSLFLNFGWLAIAFLAAWCIGRPYDRGHLTVVAAAIVLECHTLVVREPGAAKNDLAAAALLLAAIAILVNAWSLRRSGDSDPQRGRGSLPVGWPLAVAGVAAGLAVGTKSTALAMAAALTLAAVVLAPAGRRWAAAMWWLLPALAGGGYWYLRNLIVAGNPLPQATNIGPISLPHPERLQEGRPNFNIVHYATDTSVWRHYFFPGLHQAFGLLWPLVVGAAIAGALLVLLRGPDRVVRWVGGVALFGMLAYLFTPLSAAGVEGAPVGFAINVRYAIPALLAGLVLLPLAFPPRGRRREWGMLAALLAILIVTDRADAVLRDPSRLFGLGLATLVVLIPAVIVCTNAVLVRRSLPAGGAAGGTAPEEASATAGGGGSPAATGPAGARRLFAVAMTVLGLVIAAIGYPVQRHYLRDRYLNRDPETSIPGMHLDSAYRWARDVHDARIGLAGTTAGFLEYGFYGADLSNRVRYLGLDGPHGAYNAIPTCREFRAAVDEAGLDYLVTSPLLNFIHPGDPVPSPEAGWLRGEPAVTAISRSGPVTVWKVRGELDPAGCGPINAPLRRIPNAPGA